MIKFFKGAFGGDCRLIVEWEVPVNRIYDGKKIKGRYTQAYGDSDFNYAGRLYKPKPWNEHIKTFKIKAEKLVLKELGRHVEFNFLLCGYYAEDGVGIPHHSDTVPTLDDLVVSISFWSPRIFQWQEYRRHIKKETSTSMINTHYIAKKELTNYLMEDGDAFIFDGHSQMKATHSVLDVVGGGQRVNLTFRTGI